MEQATGRGVFGRWDALPARYRYIALAGLAFLAALAAGASDFRWATPVWVIALLGGAFLCFYAYPSVWRYLFHLGLIYVLVAVGAVMPLFYVDEAPLFIGWAFVFHAAGVLVAYNLVKDVVLHRRAYHMAALQENKVAPYEPVGLWLLALAGFIVFTDLSMVGFSRWALQGDPLTIYVVAEVVVIGLMLFLLDVPERAFGGKGTDFVPRVSLEDITTETKRVAKRLVKRTRRERSSAKAARAAEAARRPKQLAGGTLECPACGSELAIDVRRCPECYKENEFAWCPVSEHYIIPCPACGRPTVYGEKECGHCGTPLTLAYKCPSCFKPTLLKEWERA